jgi:RimJ/RimL family protein N-acetyltransferase
MHDTPAQTAVCESLLLRPLRAAEAPALSTILARPDLKRRDFAPARAERQPIDWSPRRRTFGAFCNHALVGALELVADEDDPDTWELGLSLTQSGIGGRSATAVLFYAFEQLGAEMVWCWARSQNQAIERLTRRFGFVASHSIPQPSGGHATVYELDAAGWDAHRRAVARHYLKDGAMVILCDEVTCWRGEAFGFLPAEARHRVSVPVQALPPDL